MTGCWHLVCILLLHNSIALISIRKLVTLNELVRAGQINKFTKLHLKLEPPSYRRVVKKTWNNNIYLLIYIATSCGVYPSSNRYHSLLIQQRNVRWQTVDAGLLWLKSSLQHIIKPWWHRNILANGWLQVLPNKPLKKSLHITDQRTPNDIHNLNL